MSSVFKIYSPEDCDFYYDGEFQGHIDSNSDRAFRFEVERKGVYRLKFVNSEYKSELVVKVSIDADEEQEVELDFSEVNEPIIQERERIIIAIEHDYESGGRLPEEIISAISNNGIVSIPQGTRKIGYKAFYYYESLTNVTIPNSVTEIGHLAFDHCKSLTGVNIPNSVTKIGRQAFANCERLDNVTIPNSVTEIEQYTFIECYSLKSITIPNSVTEIGYMAFYQCNALTSVTIPNSVTKIGAFAFCDCYSLTSIYCKATTPPMLSTGSFGTKSGRKIYVPKSECSTVLKAYELAILRAYSNAYSDEGWHYYDGIIEEYDFNNE